MQLQGVDSAAYQTRCERSSCSSDDPIPAVRGDIMTSDGTVLALTVQTYTVFADPTRC